MHLGKHRAVGTTGPGTTTGANAMAAGRLHSPHLEKTPRSNKKKAIMFQKTPRNHVSCWLVAPLLICVACPISATVTTTNTSYTVILRAARGRDARLPCGQGIVFLDGPDAFVLWLKDDIEFIYRFPNDDSDTGSSAGEHMYGPPCLETICHEETALVLKQVSSKDEGRYRCRIHYQASPAADYVIELHVVDPPGEPHLYDETGEEIKKGLIGPVALGSQIYLVCEVHDANPHTVVFWKRNEVEISRAPPSPPVLRTDVRVESASREDHDTHYECFAQNADVTPPIRVGVLIKVNLPPLSIEIRMNKNAELEAGQPRVVDCVVIGCVPPPTVTWYLGETALRPNVHKELHDGNYTVSSLTLSPSLRDSGRDLVCRAHNPNMADQVFEDRVKIKVGYRPHCVSSREEMVGAMPGEVEAVFCLVEASPPPLQFTWIFADSRTVYTSVKKVSGYTSRYSSGLTWLPKDTDLGSLQCHATNSLGDQRRPCTFTVAPGGPPRAPRCYMLSAHPLKVHCKKDWDGGRPQTVHLEVYNAGTLILNVTEQDGRFTLPAAVENKSNLTGIVYASNLRGRSETRPVRLEIFRPLVAGSVATTVGVDVDMEIAEPTILLPVTKENPAWMNWLKAIGIGAACLVSLNVVILLFRAFYACYEARTARRAPDLVANSTDGSFHREPDVAREERVIGSTNITVNQHGFGTCQNQYASSPVPACRALLPCGRNGVCGSAPANTHSYYV